MKVKLDEGAWRPTRAHEADAGLDIKSRRCQNVPAHGSAVFLTGVHVEIPRGHAGVLISKSGLNVKYGITSTGLIDEGYTGEIVVKLFNNSDEDYMVQNGDKISQLVIIPIRRPSIEIVDELGETDRGHHGFGSSGR